MDLILAVRPAMHGDPRLVRGLVLLLVLTVTAVLLAFAPGLQADAQAVDRGTIFEVGSDANVPQADSADAVIAIGGDVTVAGTVRNTIVAVGGDVDLAPTAQVGTDLSSGDSAVILVGGDLTRAQGATVQGDVSTVTGSWAGDFWNRGIVDSVTSPFTGFALFSWIGGTLLALLGAIVIVALLPRQVVAIGHGVRARFWPSLGWGVLGLVVVVPVVTVLLIISIIGLLAILPWLFVVIATAILGAVGVAVLLGQLILPRLSYRGESLILAAVIGVLVLQLVQLIPIAGSIAVAVAWIVGFGAALIALWNWQRGRRERARELREVQRDDMAA
jgi:hypothetical protein